MGVLGWMCGKIRHYMIRNENIRERVGVTPIVKKMVENRRSYVVWRCKEKTCRFGGKESRSDEEKSNN